MKAANAALTDLRIVAALSPKAFFGGHDFERGHSLLSALRALGVTLEVLLGDEWLESNRESVVRRLKRFQPDLVIGLPNAGYGLFYRDPRSDENLFSDILRVPVALLWDHIITQAPGYFLKFQEYEFAPTPGALLQLKAGLGSDLFYHFLPDSGHAEIFHELGLLDRSRTFPYQATAFAHFVDYGRRSPHRFSVSDRVGFAGNVYMSSTATSLEDPIVSALDDALITAKRKFWDVSGWHIYTYLLAQLTDDVRSRHGLDPDFRFFWKAASDLLSLRVATAFRLEVLNAVPCPVDFFGNFAVPQEHRALVNRENIRYLGSVDNLTELPEVFSRYAVWVDVTNTPFIRGCGAKVFDCFAAGSLMLIDYRDDLVSLLGEIAEAFMYRDRDELKAKVSYYLSHDRERNDLVTMMQAQIRTRYSFQHELRHVCETVITSL